MEAGSDGQVAMMCSVYGRYWVVRHSVVLMGRGLGCRRQDVGTQKSRSLEGVVLDSLREQYAARYDLMTLEAVAAVSIRTESVDH